MLQFSRESLGRTLNVQSDLILSLYMPTETAGRDVRENRIRFKNALQRIEEDQQRLDLPHEETNRILDQIRSLEQNDSWWQHQQQSLALFAVPNDHWWFQLPIEIEQQQHLASHPQIRPLLPLLQDDGQYYILTVSQSGVRLFRATRFDIEELSDADMPSNLSDALNIDEYTNTLQHHSSGPSGNRNSTIFHGQGDADLGEERKKEIVQYFRIVSDALDDALEDRSAPIVFAGVGYLFPLFEQVSKRATLVGKPIEGNPSAFTNQQLHARSWELVKNVFQADRARAIDRVQQAIGDELLSEDVEETVAAARHGLVDTLLLASDRVIRGRVQTQASRVSVAQHAMTNSLTAETTDLLNDAAIHVLKTGGMVYTTTSERLEGSSLRALLRCPVSL